VPDQDWLEKTTDKIHSYKQKLNKNEYKKHKLDFVERLAKRVSQFSDQCGECYQFQGEITYMLRNLEGMMQLSPLVKKNYNQKINGMGNHLRKKHKLVKAGTYLAIGNAVGAALGVSIGAATGNIGAGIGIGIGIGAGIGSALESKAKKDGRLL
jgi:F0F1-type ATP synthase membrane subunit c/vacuolar-type H+-ATPase subunit K